MQYIEALYISVHVISLLVFVHVILRLEEDGGQRVPSCGETCLSLHALCAIDLYVIKKGNMLRYGVQSLTRGTETKLNR